MWDFLNSKRPLAFPIALVSFSWSEIRTRRERRRKNRENESAR